MGLHAEQRQKYQRIGVVCAGLPVKLPQIGSPYYLSPEICEDRPYNRKSDGEGAVHENVHDALRHVPSACCASHLAA